MIDKTINLIAVQNAAIKTNYNLQQNGDYYE
jgi:hypothetical protein